MAKDMMLLSADTSSSRFSIAILTNGVLVDEYEAADINRHSSDLIPQIDGLLSRNSYKTEDIKAFCVGLGPGSFTGLRVGLTTMRALAVILKRPIAGISSMDAIAYNLLGHNGLLCPIIDAKQKKLYARIYECKGKRIKPKTGFLLLRIEELLKKIKKPTLFTGDGIVIYKDDIIRAKAELASFAPEPAWNPKAAIIGKLGFERLKSGKKDNAVSLSPLYIYPKECQVRKSSKVKTQKSKLQFKTQN